MAIDKREVLEESIASRKDEILMYQINIDNFRAAAAKARADYANDTSTLGQKMREYAKRLDEMAEEALIEQTKSKLTLAALESQLTAMPVGT